MRSQFFGDEPLDDLFRDWYLNALRALKEPRLHSNDALEVAYRFLWLRTFHEPIAVRTFLKGGDATLVTKQTDGQGGYQMGRISINRQRKLEDAEWATLVAAIEEIAFWDLSTNHPDGSIGIHGAQWVVEGYCQGKYHLVHRWSDQVRSTIAPFCLLLVELSGLDVEEVY